MPTLLKTAGVLKLKSYWLKRIQLADSAVMKGFLKATSEHMNGFPKSQCNRQFSWDFYILFAVAFGTLFIWPLAAFEQPFMTTLAAYGKMGQEQWWASTFKK